MEKIKIQKNVMDVKVDFIVSVFDEAKEAVSKYNLDSLAYASNEDSFISVEVDKYCFNLVTNGSVLVDKIEDGNFIEHYTNADFDFIRELVKTGAIYNEPYDIIDSNVFEIEYGEIIERNEDGVSFNRIDNPIPFDFKTNDLSELITMFCDRCSQILEDLLYETEIIGEILEDGEVERGQTNQGLVYSNPFAYRNKNGVCYVAELSDDKYTYEDFLSIANQSEEIANVLFETVDWQSPGTLYDELIQSDEIHECTACEKSYLSYDVEECPFCKSKKNI